MGADRRAQATEESRHDKLDGNTSIFTDEFEDAAAENELEDEFEEAVEFGEVDCVCCLDVIEEFFDVNAKATRVPSRHGGSDSA